MNRLVSDNKGTPVIYRSLAFGEIGYPIAFIYGKIYRGKAEMHSVIQQI
jgi:hypothetical protein